MRTHAIIACLFAAPALLVLQGCDYDEGLVIENMTGTIVVPRAAATRDVEGADGVIAPLTDTRFIGPVYLGFYASVVEGVELYPHPEVGPQYQQGKPGDTYPYGGTTVGDFRYACMESLKCRMVSGRYESYQSIIDWFDEVVGAPVIDAAGRPVESGEFLRQTCLDLLNVFSDEEIRLLPPDRNGDGVIDKLDLDFVEREDGNFEAEFIVWQQEFFEGFSLWGYMDAPSLEDFGYSTCNRANVGYQEIRYDSQFFAGQQYVDLLNTPAIYLGPGDWVAGPQTSPSGETLGYVYDQFSDQPELWLNVEVGR